MPRRKGNVTRPDRKLEEQAAREQKAVAKAREVELARRLERNRTWYVLYHGLGYTQDVIAAVSNEALEPDDPSWVTEDTVQKALARGA